MSLRWFQCKNCKTAIKKDSKPDMSNCSASSFHLWKDLGEVGDTNYNCKHCGLTIQTKSKPEMSGCPDSSFHSWNKL